MRQEKTYTKESILSWLKAPAPLKCQAARMSRERGRYSRTQFSGFDSQTYLTALCRPTQLVAQCRSDRAVIYKKTVPCRSGVDTAQRLPRCLVSDLSRRPVAMATGRPAWRQVAHQVLSRCRGLRRDFRPVGTYSAALLHPVSRDLHRPINEMFCLPNGKVKRSPCRCPREKPELGCIASIGQDSTVMENVKKR